MLGVRLCGVHVCHFTEADWTDGRGGHCHHHSRQRARLGVETALKNVTSTGAASLLRASVVHILGCTASSPVIRCCRDSHRLPTCDGNVATVQLFALSFDGKS